MRFNATFSTETLQKDIQNIHIFTLSFRIQTIIFTITNQLVHLLGLKAIDYWAEAEKTTIFTRFLIRMTQQQEVILCARMEEGKNEERERDKENGM